jgi:hypothetical protein
MTTTLISPPVSLLSLPLVPAPEFVAKGFDDMISGDTQVRYSLFDHLQHAAQHTGDSPKWHSWRLGIRRRPW